MRTARFRSLVLLGCRSIIRFSNTFPVRAIARVVNVLMRSLVAVPAFSRVEPVRTSGPRSATKTIEGRRVVEIFIRGLEETRIVAAWRLFASARAPQAQ